MKITFLPTFLLIPLLLACFALSPTARAVDPPPDGGYDGNNTAEGTDALFNLDTSRGLNNTALGFRALYNNRGGDRNTATGATALFSNRIGFDNTANGADALLSNTTGSGNTAIGRSALSSNTTGTNNTAIGDRALWGNTTGHTNTAIAPLALAENTIGNSNIAVGYTALHNGNGDNNIAVGFSALFANEGDNNIAVGDHAGFNLTTGSNNIDIGNQGVAGEANTIRIGKQGTQTATFIAGISAATVAGGVTVIVDANGQLGTIVSSERFKQAVKPMDKASEAILALRPVTFRYKPDLDPKGIPQFGLVAEDVEKVNPDLVARDEQGKPYTVRYEAVNTMLLNEFLKEHQKVQRLEAALAAINERLKAQDSKIDKVNARVEMIKPGPQMVVNNP